MTDSETDREQDAQNPKHELRCPICSLSRLTREFLNLRNGSVVRLYQCQCGELIWND